MKLSVTDLAKKLQMDEETLSALEGGSFSMKPVYHRRSNTLSIQLHLEKALSFGVRERLLARMQKELQVKVDLRVEAADGTVGIMDLLDYLQHFVSLQPQLRVFTETLPSLQEEDIVYQVRSDETIAALEAGLPNLLQHVENITNVYNLPCVVAINAFPTATKAELDLVEAKCRELGVNVALSEVWARGGEGGLALADEVVALCENGDEAGRSADTFTFSYEDDLSIAEKIEAIAKRVYHADGVVFEPAAQKEIAQLEALGFGEMPVCMAKTQYSFSDDATKLGAPRDFQITVRQVKEYMAKQGIPVRL